jgi:hypothetical protein
MPRTLCSLTRQVTPAVLLTGLTSQTPVSGHETKVAGRHQSSNYGASGGAYDNTNIAFNLSKGGGQDVLLQARHRSPHQ